MTVCMDPKCHTMCVNAKIDNCVLLDSPELPLSDFGKEAFFFFSFLKFELMRASLTVVDEVFFFDADVLLFRNPFIETHMTLNTDGKDADS